MKRWTASNSYLETARARINQSTRTNADDPILEKIADWLANLRLLNGVPLGYMVSNERMLPQESIRFFMEDENWIYSLIDGAFSIGRSTSGDVEFDSSHWIKTKKTLKEKTGRLRSRLLNLKSSSETNETVNPDLNSINSGFLLRSAVVAGWPGLEVSAYTEESDSAPLKILRFDRLADDLLFCLFEGKLQRVRIHEPAETLHFGFELPDSPSQTYYKKLKYVEDPTGKNLPGSQIEGVQIETPFRSREKRTVDISALANSIKDSLIKNGGMSQNHPYTPAEFGLELIQGVQEVDFIANDPASVPQGKKNG